MRLHTAYEIRSTDPPAHCQSADDLARLKLSLLAQATVGVQDDGEARLLRQAAAEAEALAWLTPFPLLLLPGLFEEKCESVRSYAARQARLRQGCPLARQGAR